MPSSCSVFVRFFGSYVSLTSRATSSVFVKAANSAKVSARLPSRPPRWAPSPLQPCVLWEWPPSERAPSLGSRSDAWESRIGRWWPSEGLLVSPCVAPLSSLSGVRAVLGARPAVHEPMPCLPREDEGEQCGEGDDLIVAARQGDASRVVNGVWTAMRLGK